MHACMYTENAIRESEGKDRRMCTSWIPRLRIYVLVEISMCVKNTRGSRDSVLEEKHIFCSKGYLFGVDCRCRTATYVTWRRRKILGKFLMTLHTCICLSLYANFL